MYENIYDLLVYGCSLLLSRESSSGSIAIIKEKLLVLSI